MAAITQTGVAKASTELAAMRRSLKAWLKFRSINDAVAAGTAPTKKPLAYAQRAVRTMRDQAAETELAVKLHALLSAINPDARLPSDAVSLAQIAITGQFPPSSPSAVGGLFSSPHPALWPALIVGGLLLAFTTYVRTQADVAKDAEEKACIEAGACTDYGFWLKAGGVLAFAWFAWKELGADELVRGMFKKGGRR